MSMNRFLARLIWLCILPLVVLAAYLAYVNVREIRAQTDLEAENVAENLARSIDQNLRARIRALQIVAASPHVGHPDQWSELYGQAQAFRERFESHIILADTNLQMLINTRAPLGAPLPKLPRSGGSSAAPIALATGKPAVGDIVQGPIAREPLVAVAVPVTDGGTPQFVLLTTIETRSFATRLNDVALRDGWALALVDGQGKTIARRKSTVMNPPADPGKRFVAKSTMSPWSVALDIPPDVYQAPQVAAAAALGTMILGATLTGILGAGIAGRHLRRSIDSLAKHENPASLAPEIAEVSAVRRLLDDAARERERAENAKSASEQAFRTVFDNAAAGIGIFSRDGQFIEANPALCDFLGYRREDLLGRNFRELTHSDDLEANLADYRRMMAGEISWFSMEKRYLKSDGSAVWARTSVARLPHIEGLPDRNVAVIVDIQRSKDAESALAASESHFRSMIENAPDLIVTIDPGGLISYVSPSTERLSGYPASELVGRSIMDFTHPEDLPLATEILGRVREAPAAPQRAEVRLVRKDGSVAILESVAKNELSNPALGAIVINARDVTARRAALQRERESEERYRALAEQSIAAIYVVQDGKIVYVNPRAREIFGYTAEEPFDPDPLAHVDASDRARVAAEIERRYQGESEGQYTLAARRKDGSVFTLGVHSKLAMLGGRPAIFSIAQDVTEKARAEMEITRYVARLKRMMTGTIEVVSTIGELRDPYTHGHEHRVGDFAFAIAKEMGLSADRVDGIRIAGYLHDVGKIAVPAEILSKPSRLSVAEFELVKAHAQQGHAILKSIEFPWPVAECAWQHHERMNGSGYPRGLAGDAILLEARILAIADTVEAMASHRPYRPGLGIDKALAEIERQRGTAYDAAAVDACLRLFREKGFVLAS